LADAHRAPRFLTGTTRSLAQTRDEVLPDLASCHLRYPGFGHLDWPEPLDGNEHGDVEYRLLREEWLADLCATTAIPPSARWSPAIPGMAASSSARSVMMSR